MPYRDGLCLFRAVFRAAGNFFVKTEISAVREDEKRRKTAVPPSACALF